MDFPSGIDWTRKAHFGHCGLAGVKALISQITDALRGSKEEYQDVIRDFECLDRTVQYVELLTGPPDRFDDVYGVKCVAQSSSFPFAALREKIKKPDRALQVAEPDSVRFDKNWRSNNWAFGPETREEIIKLQHYVNILNNILNEQMKNWGLEGGKIEEGAEENFQERTLAQLQYHPCEVPGCKKVYKTMHNQLRHCSEKHLDPTPPATPKTGKRKWKETDAKTSTPKKVKKERVGKSTRVRRVKSEEE